MARRIAASALRAGITAEHAHAITRCFLGMVAERAVVVADERAPEFLHTGRTAVILLEDLGVAEHVTVAAGVLFDSLHPELAGPALELAAAGGQGVARLLGELATPVADDAELVEALVTASDAARLVAVTERLDHARHLHLTDPSGWTEFHRQFSEVFVPLAQRTHPRLAHRCERWALAFGERRLPV